MQKALVLLIVSVVLVSGCASFPGLMSLIGRGELSITTNPDIFISAKTNPQEIVGGRPIKITFEAENKQPIVDLKNVSVNVYDPCVFSGNLSKTLNLSSNQTKGWSWDWTSEKVSFERDCMVGFITSWESQYSNYQDVIVLSDAEYTAREQSGTLNDIAISSSETTNPMQIQFTFLDSQPFLSGNQVTMFINYVHNGDGILSNLTDVVITIPNNLKNPVCRDYDVGTDSEGLTTLTLNHTLEFVNNIAPKSTCKFDAFTDNTVPVNMGTIKSVANYKYQLDNQLIVKVKPR